MMINISKKLNMFFDKTRNLFPFVFSVTVFGVLAFGSSAFADVNQQINYQGKLTNTSGDAVADDIYNMEFKLYTVSSGGSPVWTETRTSGDRVQVTDGFFSVMLGEVTALTSVNFNQTLYLGVNIGGTSTPSWDGEMTPRKKFGAVPAAIQAVYLGTATSTQYLRSDQFGTLSSSTSSTLLTLNQLGSGMLLDIQKNGVSALAILNNGNVGIGTSSPSTPLTVVGSSDTFTVTNNSSVQTISGFSTPMASKFIDTTANAVPVVVHVNSNQATSRPQLLLSNSAGGFWENNFMGMAVHGSSFSYNSINDYYLNDGVSDAGLATLWAQGSEITKFAIGTANSVPLAFMTGNYERMSVTSSGLVGIGTSSPSHTLTVAGDVNITGALRSNGVAGASGYVLQTTGSGTQWVATSSLGISGGSGTVDSGTAGQAAFYSSDGTTLSATSTLTFYNEKIGIGTTTPVEKLHVAGNILVGAQTDSSTDWSRVSSSTAGIIAEDSGSSTAISSTTVSAVYNGSLYIGTSKANAAEVYRYDGNGTWTQLNVTGTAGKFATTTNIDAVTAMTVYNGYLYIGTSEANSAEVYRYDGGTTWTQLNFSATAGRFLTETSIAGVTAMAVHNGVLYIGTSKANAAEVYRYDGGTTWAEANATAGTFITQASVDTVSSMVSFNRNLYIGTTEATKAQLIRLDGSAVWVQLTSAAGTVGATTVVDGITSLAVYNGSLYIGTSKANAAEVYRHDPTISDGAVAANFLKVSDTTAGTIVTGGTANIDKVISMSVYNGNLYIGTSEPTAGEIYRYDSIKTFVKISNSSAGGIPATSPPTTSITEIPMLQTYNGKLYAFTGKPSATEAYEYTTTEGQSYSLMFNAKSDNTGVGEIGGFFNTGSLTFLAEEQARNNEGTENTGRFLLSHGLNTSFGAYDLAEDYPTRDYTLAAADLVSLDTAEKGFVRKSFGRNDRDIIGVYSENPALRLSQKDAHIDGARAVPIALAGRVPVKVSLENGPIKIGDYITASSEAGIAAKAVRPGRVVGRALSSYSGAEDEEARVTIFIGAETINWNDISDAARTVSELAEITKPETQDTMAWLIEGARMSIADIAVAVINEADNVSVTITNKLIALVASIKQLFVDTLTILPGGNLFLPSGENQIAGSDILPAGQTEIFVSNSQIDSHSSIYLTPTSETEIPLYVAEKKVGQGFIVRISKPLPQNITFDWFFVKIYDSKNKTEQVVTNENATTTTVITDVMEASQVESTIVSIELASTSNSSQVVENQNIATTTNEQSGTQDSPLSVSTPEDKDFSVSVFITEIVEPNQPSQLKESTTAAVKPITDLEVAPVSNSDIADSDTAESIE